MPRALRYAFIRYACKLARWRWAIRTPEDIVRSTECKAVDRLEAQEGAGGQIIGLDGHDNVFEPLHYGGHVVHDRNAHNLRRPRARGLACEGNCGLGSTHLAIPKLKHEEL